MESKSEKFAKKDSSEKGVDVPNKNDEHSGTTLPKQICAQATPFPGCSEWTTPTRAAMQADFRCVGDPVSPNWDWAFPLQRI